MDFRVDIWKFVRWILTLLIFAMLYFVDIACQCEVLRAASLGGWYYILSNAGMYALFTIGIMMMIGKKVSFISVIIYAYLAIFATVSLFLRIGFKMTLNKEIFFIISASSLDESKAFLDMVFTPLNFGLLVMVVAIGWLCGKLIYTTTSRYALPHRWRFIGVVFVLIFLFFVSAWNNYSAIISRARCLRIWKDYLESRRDAAAMLEMTQHPVLPIGIRSTIPEGVNPFYVFVIGESACRNYMSIYGYDKVTTPTFDSIKDEMYCWNDVLTAWPRTTGALTYLLTQATRDNPTNYCCTLTDIYKAAGYRTVYFSALSQWGDAEGSVAKFFYNAQHKDSLVDRFNRKTFDTDLNELLLEELNNQSTNPCSTVVFLHLVGSHFPPDHYMPKDWHKFERGAHLGDYLNSIAFTDVFFEKLFINLRTLNRPTMVFYISDHGESPGSANWRDLDSRDTWEIPMCIWLSSEFREQMFDIASVLDVADKNIPLQGDELFCGLCHLMSVTWPGFPASMDFLSSGFVPKKSRPTH